MEKLRVALLFGGVSSEHEVSCVSASTILEHLDPEKYIVYPIGITRQGSWYLCGCSIAEISDGRWEHTPLRRCVLSPDRADRGFLILEEGKNPEALPVDLVFPVLHGRNGEDGRVPALCQLAGLPFVGCDMLSSAVCMDKAVANSLFDHAGIPRCEWTWADRVRCHKDPLAVARQAAEKLGWPIFVKPANAGSSVGISKAGCEEELLKAMEVALEQDDKVVFERFVEGQEVECAVLGNDELMATHPGEILAGAEFYTYDDKYKNGVSQTLIPARLSPEKLDEVTAQAKKAYRTLGCQGLARCDFFVEKDTGRVLVNEINTLPGFTAISMYPKLMEDAGLPLPQLLDRLISLGLERAGRYYG